MTIVVVDTEATAQPVSLEEAKAHLNIDSTDDDLYIDGLLLAATSWAEDFTNSAFCTKGYSLYLDSFSNEIIIPRLKLINVSSITYIDSDGVTQTLSSSVYKVDVYRQPGRIVLAYNQSWPVVRNEINAIRIQYTAGYGAETAIPEAIKHAIKILVAHWYEHRELAIVGTIISDAPLSVESLLSSYKVFSI